MRDLYLLVADKNMEFAVRGILEKPIRLGIRDIDFEIKAHWAHDGGLRTAGHELLALNQRRFRHGILMLDFEGSGTNLDAAGLLEQELDMLIPSSWEDRAKTIVIDPESDVWIWGSDNFLKPLLNWNAQVSIRDWLREQKFEFDANQKPIRPKEALEALLRKVGTPRSSALYKNVTTKISLDRCKDPAFLRFRETLQKWFPR